MPLKPQTLKNLLQQMTDSRKSALLAIYEQYKELFHFATGSSHNHQAWKGGYADHIAACIRINHIYYNGLAEELPPPPFKKDSATIALFFHDIEKPFKYGPVDCDECNKWRDLESSGTSWEEISYLILDNLQERFMFHLSKDEINAIKYAHGEGEAYQKGKRVASPLAAHVHNCDNTSARIYHNYGKGLA